MDFEPEQIAQLQARTGIDCQALIWIIPRDRSTGDDAPMGFWTGDDHQTFVIGGETRSYFGAGAVVEIAPVVSTVGLDVRVQRIVLPPLLDEVRMLLRGYDPRNAPVEVHVQQMSLETGNPLGTPVRVIKGTLDMAPETLDQQESRLELQIVSSAQALTIGRSLLRSNAALLARSPSDQGREYSDTAGEWVVPWGEQ